MEAFESLKKKVVEINKASVNELNGNEANTSQAQKKLICCLLSDEMSTRRHIQFNPATKAFDGFIDTGCPIEGENLLPVAKDALVFMVSGVTEDFKIPIGYFFASGLNADERAALTNEALRRLDEIGIAIVSLTLDGHAANIKMCKLLGADFNEEKAYFPHPMQSNHKVYCFLDPPHMLKLVRNCIGTRNLIDGDGGIIQWKFFELLYETQKNLPWNFANKITKAHMEWDRQKMSVRLAAELLSNSCADALEFLKSESEEFSDVDATVKFIRVFNDIFDIMNSTKKSTTSTGFKRPISTSTCQEMFQRFDEAEAYLIGLSVEGETKSIFSSSVYTAFIGFYNDMINFKSIYKEYVETNKIDILFTHRFSQDLLESFFGSIRSMGGIGLLHYILLIRYSL